jgi:UPF0042 nucleotide-binding protein
MLTPMELILISGLSGSGKSVALNLLEDCRLLLRRQPAGGDAHRAHRHAQEEGIQKTAVAIDARSGHGIDLLPRKCRSWRNRAST